MTRSWWDGAVIYEIYPRSFADSDGNGVGDLRGIIEHLDHLAGRDDSLGVDAIWLAPFYASPWADGGYDVADHCAVHPTLGTLSDFDELVAACHRRGLQVLVDLVPNHTSDRHPWFEEARRSRGSARRDWYVWRDPRADGSPPNDWQSAFAGVGPVWTFDPGTDQYYLHSYLSQQPDLDWWNPAVRRAFDRIIGFWLDRGVDGFRIDVAHKMARDPALRDHEAEVAAGGRRRDEDWPEVHEILRDFRRSLDARGNRLALGEVGLVDIDRVVPYFGRDDELHLAFDFEFMHARWDAETFRRAIERAEALTPSFTVPTYVLGSHDVPRIASRFDGDGRGIERSRLLAVLLLTLRGTIVLYQGDELGSRDVPVIANESNDRAGRDPQRAPMVWQAEPDRAFTHGTPWLPLPATERGLGAVEQRRDPSSILSLVTRLLALRRRASALQGGPLEGLMVDGDVLTFRRHGHGDSFLVAVNFGLQEATVQLGDATAEVVVSSRRDRPMATLVRGSTLSLGPLEAIVTRGLDVRAPTV